jgi:hypothetical protein
MPLSFEKKLYFWATCCLLQNIYIKIDNIMLHHGKYIF